MEFATTSQLIHVLEETLKERGDLPVLMAVKQKDGSTALMPLYSTNVVVIEDENGSQECTVLSDSPSVELDNMFILGFED